MPELRPLRPGSHRPRSPGRLLVALPALALLSAGAASEPGIGGEPHPQASFFATSVGNGASGGDYGGSNGADARCQSLAETAGLPAATWAAYLSTSEEDARDRIGAGPWVNYDGTVIADDAPDLHANGIPAADVLDEYGQPIPGSAHDILTGSQQNGTLHSLGANCGDFMVSDSSSYGSVGHSDGGGVGDGGTDGGAVAVSWNAAHLSGCDQAGMTASGGEGRIYCFVTGGADDPPIFTDGFESGDTSLWSVGGG